MQTDWSRLQLTDNRSIAHDESAHYNSDSDGEDFHPEDSERSYGHDSQFRATVPDNCAIKNLRLEVCEIDFEPRNNVKLKLRTMYCEASHLHLNKWLDLPSLEDLTLIQPSDPRTRYMTHFEEMVNLKRLSVDRVPVV